MSAQAWEGCQGACAQRGICPTLTREKCFSLMEQQGKFSEISNHWKYKLAYLLSLYGNQLLKQSVTECVCIASAVPGPTESAICWHMGCTVRWVGAGGGGAMCVQGLRGIPTGALLSKICTQVIATPLTQWVWIPS